MIKNFQKRAILLPALLLAMFLSSSEAMAFTNPTQNPTGGVGSIYIEASTPANALYLKSSGNVGVGTTNPSHKFQASDSSGGFVGLNPADGAVEIGSGNDGFSFIDFKGNTNLGSDYRGRFGYGDGSGFSFYTAGSGTIVMRMNELGNIGIGNTAPTTKLDVTGTVKATSFEGPLSGSISSANVSAGSFGSNTGGGNYNFPGNLGIGATSPAYKLELNSGVGSALTTVMQLSRTDNLVGGGPAILFKTSTSAVADRYGVKIGAVRSSSDNGAADFIMQLENSSAGGMGEVLRVTSGGNLGIGTATPAFKLDVAGDVKEYNTVFYTGEMSTANDSPACVDPARIYTIATVNASGSYYSYIEVEVIGSHRGYTNTTYVEKKKWNIWIGDKISSNLIESSGGDNYVGLWNGTDATGFSNQDAAGRVINLVVNPRCGAGLTYRVNVRYSSNLNITIPATRFGYVSHSAYSVTIPQSPYHVYGTIAYMPNNVGIKKTNPTTALDVNGTVTATAFSGPLSGTITAANVSSGAFGANTGGGNYSFPANVGIGTTSPTSPAGVSRFLQISGASHAGIVLTDTDAGAGSWDIWNDGGNLRVWRESVYALAITPAGNVGFGNTAAAYKLDVTGDGHFTGWVRTDGTNGWYSQTYGGGWFMQDTTWLRTYGSKSIWTSSGVLGSDGGLTVGYGGAAAPAGGAIIAGNVGIGTSAPSAKFTVDGNITQFTTHGNNMKLWLSAARNGGGTGEVGLYSWISEPGMTWTGGGIARNMYNTTSFPRINTGLSGQMLHFSEGGNIEMTVETSAGSRTTPLTVSPGTATVTGTLNVTGNANICHLVAYSGGATSCPAGYYTWSGSAAASGYMLCCKVDNPI